MFAAWAVSLGWSSARRLNAVLGCRNSRDDDGYWRTAWMPEGRIGDGSSLSIWLLLPYVPSSASLTLLPPPRPCISARAWPAFRVSSHCCIASTERHRPIQRGGAALPRITGRGTIRPARLAAGETHRGHAIPASFGVSLHLRGPYIAPSLLFSAPESLSPRVLVPTLNP